MGVGSLTGGGASLLRVYWPGVRLRTGSFQLGSDLILDAQGLRRTCDQGAQSACPFSLGRCCGMQHACYHGKHDSKHVNYYCKGDGVTVDIEYVDEDLDPTTGAIRRIQRRRGPEVAKAYMKLIGLVAAAENRHDLSALIGIRLHPLKGNRKGEWSLTPKRSSPFRVICDFGGESVCDTEGKQEALRILGLEDYH